MTLASPEELDWTDARKIAIERSEKNFGSVGAIFKV
jgi:hypothetical protein